MHDLVLFAVPFFIVFLALEAISFKIAKAEDGVVGYERRDTATSLTMGLGSVVIGAVWALVVIVFYAALYTISPLRMPTDQIWPWLLLFFLDDLAFYAYHRISHEVRVFWASHVVHHSSQHYNLSTALRQPWVPITAVPFWAPLALLGYQPWMIFAMQSVSLIYQFFLHTERIHRFPKPIEFIFNTPSHHRVHHGTNDLYLDRNYGGMLIIWDRLFGSFEPEDEKAVYGLTTNIETFNPVRVAFHEYVAVWNDVRHAHGCEISSAISSAAPAGSRGRAIVAWRARRPVLQVQGRGSLLGISRALLSRQSVVRLLVRARAGLSDGPLRPKRGGRSLR